MEETPREEKTVSAASALQRRRALLRSSCPAWALAGELPRAGRQEGSWDWAAAPRGLSGQWLPLTCLLGSVPISGCHTGHTQARRRPCSRPQRPQCLGRGRAAPAQGLPSSLSVLLRTQRVTKGRGFFSHL